MAHTIQMGNDGILRVTLSGNLERGMMDNLQRDLSVFVTASTAESQLRSIFFVESLGKISSAARQYFTEFCGDQRVGPIALINPPRRAKVLGKFIHKATGRNNIMFFEEEPQAVTWIKSENTFTPST
jgi:hypothetical protein